MNKDIRWIQRLDNFQRALRQLENALQIIEQRELNDLEKQGVIQAFEYNYELAWNTIKDFYEYQGETDIFGSRDAFRLAFRRGLILEGDIWMDMIKKRQLTVHTYNEEISEQILNSITKDYYKQFLALRDNLTKYKEGMDN